MSPVRGAASIGDQPTGQTASGNAPVAKPRIRGALPSRGSAQAQWLIAVLAVLLTLIPAVNMLRIIVGAGEDVISNDYVFNIQLVDRILNGKYDWVYYFRDASVGADHSLAIPLVVWLVSIKLTGWSVMPELYVGYAAALLKMALLFSSLTWLVRTRLRLVLLPLLGGLVFSTSQVDTFTYGVADLEIQLNQLGLVLGLWGLVRFRDTWTGVVIMSIDGIFASLSGGGGISVWPAFLVGMIGLGYRRKPQYVFWLAATLAGLAPYVYLRLGSQSPYWHLLSLVRPARSPLITLFDPVYLTGSIGFPFAQDLQLGEAFVAGLSGIVLFAAAAVMAWKRRNQPWIRDFAPAAVILLYTGINVYSSMAFRDYLAPWYNTYFVLFWIALLGVAYVFIVRGGASRGPRLWSAAFVYILVLLYARGDLTYADKATYLSARAPVSASCLRNYRTAPLYCDRYLFTWLPGHNDFVSLLARPLERHRLSVFGSHQEWALQGDWVLNSVNVARAGVPNVFWANGLSPQPAAWDSWNHLNLFLRPGNRLAWTVRVPRAATYAMLRTSVAAARLAAGQHLAVGIELRSAPQPTSTLRRFVWQAAASSHPVQISLLSYRGRTVTIVFSATSSSGDAGWAVFSYPTLSVHVTTSAPIPSQRPLPRFVPRQTSRDYVFQTDSGAWSGSHMTPLVSSSAQGAWRASSGDPYVIYRPKLDLCLSDYSYLYLRLAVPRDVYPRVTQVFYRTTRRSASDRWPWLDTPLLRDSAPHSYAYPIRLLPIRQGTRMTGLRIDPAVDGIKSGSTVIRIQSVRLIRDPGPSTCTAK